MKAWNIKAIAAGLATALALARLVGVTTTTARAQTGSPRAPAVVELYTSQGCSSCPPADHLLGEISMMPNVIALTFHVDYWDSLGWRDRFSLPNAAERQYRYVRALRLSTAFTPQAVVDGRSSFVGSDKPRISAALSERIADPIPPKLEVSKGVLTITMPATQDGKTYTLFAAAYLPHASTSVGRGENSGRMLEEFNIVREFRSIGTWSGGAQVFQTSVASFPRDASQVAVLVQLNGQGPIAGSARIALRQ
jgi:hypothetical protein